jgi:hypothetical protein
MIRCGTEINGLSEDVRRASALMLPHGSARTAPGMHERYVALAREATLNGDIVEAENCYQHAEHYFRVMRERNS